MEICHENTDIVMGLLYGQGNMDNTIVISMRCGQDSDCNPVQRGRRSGHVYRPQESTRKIHLGLGPQAEI